MQKMDHFFSSHAPRRNCLLVALLHLFLCIIVSPDDIYNRHSVHCHNFSQFQFSDILFSPKIKKNAYQNVSSLSQWHILIKPHHVELELQCGLILKKEMKLSLNQHKTKPTEIPRSGWPLRNVIKVEQKMQEQKKRKLHYIVHRHIKNNGSRFLPLLQVAWLIKRFVQGHTFSDQLIPAKCYIYDGISTSCKYHGRASKVCSCKS